jgi:iron-sulfur cluster assembly protein
MIASRASQFKPEEQLRLSDERLIRLTSAAATRVGRLLDRRGTPKGVLRVAVIGGGCSGLTYKMDLQDNPQDRDILVETNGIRVVVDPKSAMYVTGSELDYVETLQESGFKFRNPNAASSCSCGESFTT